MEPREQSLERIRREIVELKAKPSEIFFADVAEALNWTPKDWLSAGAVALAIQRAYERALGDILYGDPLRVCEMVRVHCGGVLQATKELRDWERASREFFEAYSECCYRCKSKRKVEAARARLAPVAGLEGG